MATRCVICDAEIEPVYVKANNEWEKFCVDCKTAQHENHLFYLDVFSKEDDDDD